MGSGAEMFRHGCGSQLDAITGRVSVASAEAMNIERRLRIAARSCSSSRSSEWSDTLDIPPGMPMGVKNGR